MDSLRFPAAIVLVSWVNIPAVVEPMTNKLAVSWAGLTYLTLFLCSKFAIAIPYLFPGIRSFKAFPSLRVSGQDEESSSSVGSKSNATLVPPGPAIEQNIRFQAAAPPVYLLVLAFIPIGLAIYISSTRYSDFKHHGFDIIVGSLLGFILAWGSFRWYHIPVGRGAGWSWGPRSANKAWGVGLGIQGYARDEAETCHDLEQGRNPNGRDGG